MPRQRLMLAACIILAATAASVEEVYRSPQALVASPDGKVLYVAEAGPSQVVFWDVAAGVAAKAVPVPAEPTGLALSADGSQLYVTCADPDGQVCVVDTASGEVQRTLPAGHGATAPVLSPDGDWLYVCNRFSDDVSVIEPASGEEQARVKVSREPVAAAITPDGAHLFVANLLPAGRSDADVCAAVVSVIDTAKREVVAEIALANGSGAVRGICMAPDGAHVYVAHVLARFHMPTTQLDRGWMNTNALSIIDVAKLERLNTVLLDDVDRGAANPWGVACTPDAKYVCVTHAGTHELSVIDAPALIDKLVNLPATAEEAGPVVYPAVAANAEDVPNDLSFLVGLRRRIQLDGNGPRAVAVIGSNAYVAMYFTGGLNSVDLRPDARRPVTALALGPEPPMTAIRRGEVFFNDARFCFQGWQSCVSCHPDARADGLNWDLLNDGIGNPKNAKSLLLSHETPPVMCSGIRPKAEVAVRAGIRYIQFAVRPEEDAVAIDEYLKNLKPVPSPHLVDGKLSPSAFRGKEVFFREDVGCATCHPAPLYTDLEMHDVGTRGPLDRRDDFDTSTVIEAWRTGPYLHDGRSATIMDMLTKDNPGDKHGKTSHLSQEELDDLAAFVLSL